ncbi:hypothetical protein QR680_012792 [Steinernema hermaphroditum]|uniref:Uncharacterized protein n=1 Tax=Steinernema hermaphroditum TaxID=289476 RepID=A0AA39I399_9BILA|nr:hypothetical protein QR680_012792 [Steinernema hermaphroditum]
MPKKCSEDRNLWIFGLASPGHWEGVGVHEKRHRKEGGRSTARRLLRDQRRVPGSSFPLGKLIVMGFCETVTVLEHRNNTCRKHESRYRVERRRVLQNAPLVAAFDARRIQFGGKVAVFVRKEHGDALHRYAIRRNQDTPGELF